MAFEKCEIFRTHQRELRDYRAKLKAIEKELSQCKKNLRDEQQQVPTVPQYEPWTPTPTVPLEAVPLEAGPLSRKKSELIKKFQI